MLRSLRTSPFRLLLLAGLLVCLSGFAHAQGAPRVNGPGIENAYAKPLVEVKIDVRALERPVVVPFCGVRFQNERFLCNAHIERREGGRWNPVRLRSNTDVLARIPRREWRAAVVPPGNLGTFTYTFNPEFFRVSKGDQLRIVVDYWHSKQAMATDDTDDKLFSPPFDCPY